MLSISGVACQQVWYKQPTFYNSNFSILNMSASPFRRIFLKKVSPKMTSVWGRGCPCREYSSIAPPDSSPPLKSEFSKQPTGPPGPKLSTTATNVAKYSKNNLQRTLRTVLEAQTPAPASAPAPATSKKPQNKPLKARSPDIYCGKSHMDCYNFCQQCEDYFATIGATKANQILFTVFFF